VFAEAGSLSACREELGRVARRYEARLLVPEGVAR
jgi:hypothetical protein